MLELALAIYFVVFYVANLWLVVALGAALVYYCFNTGAYAVVGLAVQPVVGACVAQALRLVHGEETSVRERVSLVRALDGPLERVLYAVLFVATLLPYRRAVIDELDHSFPLGVLISVLLMFGLALVLEMYNYYVDTQEHALQRRAGHPALFRESDLTQHFKVAGVATCIALVDLLVYEFHARWHAAVLAGVLVTLVVGSHAFDAVLDRVEGRSQPAGLRSGKAHET